MPDAGTTETQTRRRGRPPSNPVAADTAPRSSRRRTSGNPTVDRLREMIELLIKENRTLRRQVDRLSMKATEAVSGGIDKQLVSLQRRLEKVMGEETEEAPAPRRRGRPRKS